MWVLYILPFSYWILINYSDVYYISCLLHSLRIFYYFFSLTFPASNPKFHLSDFIWGYMKTCSDEKNFLRPKDKTANSSWLDLCLPTTRSRVLCDLFPSQSWHNISSLRDGKIILWIRASICRQRTSDGLNYDTRWSRDLSTT